MRGRETERNTENLPRKVYKAETEHDCSVLPREEEESFSLKKKIQSSSINVILEKGTSTPETGTPSLNSLQNVDNTSYYPTFNGTSQTSVTTPMRGDE